MAHSIIENTTNDMETPLTTLVLVSNAKNIPLDTLLLWMVVVVVVEEK